MDTRLAYQRWRSRPAWARVATAVYLYAFAEGTGWHVLDLATGGHDSYGLAAPPLIRLFFTSLIVLDPVALVLTLRLRPAAVPVAAIIAVLDLVANWEVSWHRTITDPVRLLIPVGLGPITLFAIFVLVTAVPLRRSLAGASPG